MSAVLDRNEYVVGKRAKCFALLRRVSFSPYICFVLESHPIDIRIRLLVVYHTVTVMVIVTTGNVVLCGGPRRCVVEMILLIGPILVVIVAKWRLVHLIV